MGSSENKGSTDFINPQMTLEEPSLGLLLTFSLLGVSLVMLAMALGVFLSILG